MRLRWLAFAIVIGAWSAVQCCAYLVELGAELHFGTDAFVISTTTAVGLGAFLVACVIGRELSHAPPVQLAPAWVPRRLQLRLRVPAQLALVLLLMLLECGRA